MKIMSPILSTRRVRGSAARGPLRLARAACLALAISPPVSAQSAANFDISKVEVASPASGHEGAADTAAPGQPKTPGPVSLTPSRYVTPDDFGGYVASMNASLLISGHDVDSFGQYQDPTAKPVIRTNLNQPKRVTPVYRATPFSDIVSLIRVSTVMPGDRKFLIGDREIHLGQHIPITFRGKDMKIEVTGVSASEIQFRNVESGETAPLKLNLLPAGMTPGIGGLRAAPGMVPQDNKAPIHLDGDLPSPESSQNR